MKLNERMLRGKEIYNQLGQIKKLWNDVWYVKSQSGHGTYTVTETQEGWKCQCYQIYHNYIRPHESLDGKTPSEVAGFKVEGNNKWLTLIQNAKAHHPTVNRKSSTRRVNRTKMRKP
jgi:hypothetical protein